MYRLYGFTECSWCEKAKSLLVQEEMFFEVVDLPTREERVAWMDRRGFEGDRRTFPKIYLVENDRETMLVGGYSELETLLFIGDDSFRA